jgi:phospholipid transport system substrate-binding protein
MLSNYYNRRYFLTAAAAGLGVSLMPLPALALTEASAIDLVAKMVADINATIASGKSEPAMIRDFEKLFKKYADTPIMARYALGADARQASKSQMRSFVKAFQGYIARKYGKRFREFIGGRIEIVSARKIKAGYEVKCTAFLKGEAPFEVTFLVSDKSGKNLFFNMFIEGVNLLLTERTEIGAMLDRRGGDMNAMISDLQKLS